NAGYSVKYRLLNAAEFGVPQNRLRVFIIGIRNDIDVNFEFPEPTYFQEGTLFDKSFIPLKEVIFPESEIDEKYNFSQRAVEGMLK
ncbi:DNA cytosine methyltransferase, partial [Acinetobacter baumannii]|nr:DNA cytosine methyltransferase [Acinetobacter baumannii]